MQAPLEALRLLPILDRTEHGTLSGMGVLLINSSLTRPIYSLASMAPLQTSRGTFSCRFQTAGREQLRILETRRVVRTSAICAPKTSTTSRLAMTSDRAAKFVHIRRASTVTIACLGASRIAILIVAS